MTSLRIVHCFRSPVGGIFRHVRDLVAEQLADGHAVGIVCDSNTGGAFEEAFFAELEPKLALGLHRMPMQRAIGPGDAIALWRTYRALAKVEPDVLHSHGAKGGAYARLIGSMLRRRRPLARLYCPHGGSVHYDGTSLAGRAYFRLERTLERMTDRLIFVSGYERDAYVEKIGEPRVPTTLVYNGLAPEEFEPVTAAPNARDFLYIGMLRDLKGTDLFIDAVEAIAGATAHIVGSGPDEERYRTNVRERGLGERIAFHAPMPARQAFGLARTVVVPSRAESMPYIVLEALAARRPLIATNVGGVPEIYRGREASLVPPDDAAALTAAMRADLDGTRDAPTPKDMQTDLRARFSREAMARTVLDAYRETLEA